MKKKVAVLLMIVAAVALAGCNGRGESSITSSYGSSMLAGQVVVTGVANTSPAGVEVSVRGTGMTTTLGPDGQFAFANMPEDAVLDFRRSADGIEASLRLDASAASKVTIELGPATATASSKGGRRRAAGRGGDKVYEFEGLIRTAAADRIVVYTSKKEEVTIGLTAETVIRKGQTALTPADLVAGTRVHVKARFANDAYSAILVIVQNETGGGSTPGAVKEYEGTVVSASAGELVVFTSRNQEVKFTITGDTVIRKGSATFDLAQILIGMLVHVKATVNTDGTNTATLVIVQNTRVTTTIEGTVSSVGASSLVVTTANGDMTVQVSNSTQIRQGNKKIALSAVTAGATVKVEGTLVGATAVAAKKITVQH